MTCYQNLTMINHCINDLRFTGITHEQWHDLRNSFQNVDEEGFHKFLRKYFPEPDYSIVYDARNNDIPPIFYMTHDQYVDYSCSRNPILQLNETQWRLKNWGTDRDAYGAVNTWDQENPSSEFRVRFNTAGPLSVRCIEAISYRFPGTLITNYYGDKSRHFRGVVVARDCYSLDYLGSDSQHRESFARQYPDLYARLAKDYPNLQCYLEEFLPGKTCSGDLSDSIHNGLKFHAMKMTEVVLFMTTHSPPSA